MRKTTMMTHNQGLYLNGQGYLHAVKLYDHQWFVEICRIELWGGKPQKSEALWLNCSVDDTLAENLLDYAKALQKGQTIIIQFKAQYQGVVALYSGLTDDDPAQIVMFKAKLVEIVPH
jgi:hypothetical protein